MRRIALLSALAISLGTFGVAQDAQAQDFGYGYRGNGGAQAGRGPGYRDQGYRDQGSRNYGARGYRDDGARRGGRGISTGAAVGLGVAGVAAGAIAADAARRNGYYGAPQGGDYDDED